jgi:hypothetical protein
MKRILCLVTGLVLGLAILPHAIAHERLRQNGTSSRGVTFTAAFVDEETTPTGPYGCGLAQPSVCKGRFEGSGTMEGGGYSSFIDYFGYLWFNPMTQKMEAESWDHHTGYLEGCGEGSFVMHQTNFQYDPLSFNPLTGTVHVTLEWKVLRGSGTGDFQHATGSGTGDVDLQPNLANTGTYTGTIVCPEGDHR